MTRPHSRNGRVQQRRRELANALGRDRLYALDYQDTDVLQGAFDAGYTIKEIGAAFDVTVGTITRWMDKRGVESPRALDHGDAVSEGIQGRQTFRAALQGSSQ